jgi:single-strand DNA-binding protein
MATQTEVTKIGNLTKDPTAGEGNGTTFARFSMAVETPVTPGDWKGDMETTFYEVTCFGSVADHVVESLTKGDRVAVTGKPELDTWKGRDGQDRTTKRVIANSVAVDLRFASVQINRTSRTTSRPEPASEVF